MGVRRIRKWPALKEGPPGASVHLHGGLEIGWGTFEHGLLYIASAFLFGLVGLIVVGIGVALLEGRVDL